MTLKALAVVACAISLNACSAGEQQAVSFEKQLTVTGPAAGLKKFVALQTSLRPALTVSHPETDSNGQGTAVLYLPATYTGEDLVHTTREALAAGLTYNYAERRGIAHRHLNKVG